MFVDNYMQDRIGPGSLSKVLEYFKKAIRKDDTRDSRYLMNLLARLPQMDLHLFSCLYYRQQAVKAFPYTIKFPDDVQVADTEKKQLAQMQLRFEKTKMRGLIDIVTNGRIIGASACRLDWANDTSLGNYVINKESLEPADLDYDLTDDDKLIWVNTDTKTQKAVRKNFPENYFVTKHNPLYGFDNDFVGGLLRITLLPVVLMYWDLFNWSNKNERSLIYAQYEERFKQKVSEIISQLQNIGESGVGAFSKGIEIKLLEQINEAQVNSHKELQDMIHRLISLVLTGQFTATNPAGGHSFAAADVGYQIAEDVTSGDLIAAEAEITSQYIMRDYNLNYGEPKNAYPIFEFKKMKIKNQEAKSRMVTDYIANNIPLAIEDVYDNVGFRRPRTGEQVLLNGSIIIFSESNEQ